MSFEQIEQVGGNKQTPTNIDIPVCKFQAVNWVMTWNNYPDDCIEQLEQRLAPLCKKYIFGKEVGSEGTPHIQGAFCLHKKTRQDTIWKLFGCKFFLDKMRGRWNDQKYCGKDGDFISNVRLPVALRKVDVNILRPDQRQVANLFTDREDPIFGRNVYWFWEPKGGWGKSILCKYMIDHMEAFVCEGANNDILCGISKYIEEHGECPPIIIFDIPRVNEGGVSYQAIEKLKNGYFFSSKYESGMVRFNSPHVIVFANQGPDYNKLSRDRWRIRNLRDNLGLMEVSESSEEEGTVID